MILVGPRVERAVSVLLQREARRRKRFPTGLKDPTKDTKDAKPERSSTEATGPAKGEVEHEDAKKVNASAPWSPVALPGASFWFPRPQEGSSRVHRSFSVTVRQRRVRVS